jgi:hypothetical protein
MTPEHSPKIVNLFVAYCRARAAHYVACSKLFLALADDPGAETVDEYVKNTVASGAKDKLDRAILGDGVDEMIDKIFAATKKSEDVK